MPKNERVEKKRQKAACLWIKTFEDFFPGYYRRISVTHLKQESYIKNHRSLLVVRDMSKFSDPSKP